MVWIALVFAAAAAIVWADVPRLRKSKARKELWAFSVTLAFAVGLGIAHSLRIPLPNPLDLIFLLFRPISDWMSLS